MFSPLQSSTFCTRATIARRGRHCYVTVTTTLRLWRHLFEIVRRPTFNQTLSFDLDNPPITVWYVIITHLVILNDAILWRGTSDSIDVVCVLLFQQLSCTSTSSWNFLYAKPNFFMRTKAFSKSKSCLLIHHYINPRSQVSDVSNDAYFFGFCFVSENDTTSHVA